MDRRSLRRSRRAACPPAHVPLVIFNRIVPSGVAVAPPALRKTSCVERPSGVIIRQQATRTIKLRSSANYIRLSRAFIDGKVDVVSPGASWNAPDPLREDCRPWQTLFRTRQAEPNDVERDRRVPRPADLATTRIQT